MEGCVFLVQMHLFRRAWRNMSTRYDGFLDNVSSILAEFYCKEEKSWKYSKQHLLRCGKPLSLALKVFLRINNNGIICIQHLLNDDAEVQLFIDCFLHPLETVSFFVCLSIY